MSWEDILKEQSYPCYACGKMTPSSQLLSITGAGIDSGNPVQICKKCEDKARKVQEQYAQGDYDR